MDPLALFLVLLRDSALALGGLGSLPLLRQDLVATGVVTDTQLLEALAIGRLSTGPNGLWIVGLGYQLARPLGAAMALVASSLPPLVIHPATAVARRWLLSVPFAGLVRGAALATAGLLCATAHRSSCQPATRRHGGRSWSASRPQGSRIKAVCIRPRWSSVVPRSVSY